MPDPREAVYDVLLAKKRRADEAKKVEERGRETGSGWAAYEAGNRRASAAYRHRTKGR